MSLEMEPKLSIIYYYVLRLGGAWHRGHPTTQVSQDWNNKTQIRWCISFEMVLLRKQMEAIASFPVD